MTLAPREAHVTTQRAITHMKGYSLPTSRHTNRSHQRSMLLETILANLPLLASGAAGAVILGGLTLKSMLERREVRKEIDALDRLLTERGYTVHHYAHHPLSVNATHPNPGRAGIVWNEQGQRLILRIDDLESPDGLSFSTNGKGVDHLDAVKLSGDLAPTIALFLTPEFERFMRHLMRATNALDTILWCNLSEGGLHVDMELSKVGADASFVVESLDVTEALGRVLSGLVVPELTAERLSGYVTERGDRVATLATMLLLSRHPDSPEARALCAASWSGGGEEEPLGYEVRGWALDERVVKPDVLTVRCLAIKSASLRDAQPMCRDVIERFDAEEVQAHVVHVPSGRYTPFSDHALRLLTAVASMGLERGHARRWFERFIPELGKDAAATLLGSLDTGDEEVIAWVEGIPSYGMFLDLWIDRLDEVWSDALVEGLPGLLNDEELAPEHMLALTRQVLERRVWRAWEPSRRALGRAWAAREDLREPIESIFGDFTDVFELEGSRGGELSLAQSATLEGAVTAARESGGLSSAKPEESGT